MMNKNLIGILTEEEVNGLLEIIECKSGSCPNLNLSCSICKKIKIKEAGIIRKSAKKEFEVHYREWWWNPDPKIKELYEKGLKAIVEAENKIKE